jgi:hypothetical protein
VNASVPEDDKPRQEFPRQGDCLTRAAAGRSVTTDINASHVGF